MSAKLAVARELPAGEFEYVEAPFRLSTGGARVGLFAWKFCRHSKGRWRGSPVAFEPFQLAILSDLLRVERDAYMPLTWRDLKNALERPDLFWQKVEAWLKKQPARTTLRVHREALIGLPKKNGKSTMASVLALYLLLADDEPGAEVYSAAAARDQARIVFKQARSMVEASPWLSERVDVYRNELVVPDLDAIYRVVSADAKLQEGINPSGILVDELHAHKSRDLYDTLTSAALAREQPLVVSITTAGYDLTSICGEVYLEGAGSRPRVRDDGVVATSKSKRREFYFHWRAVDRKMLEDRRAWKLANPASWVTVRRLEAERAKKRPPSIFYRYHLNAWVRVEKHWLPVGKWESLPKPTRPLDVGDPVVLTVDVGLFYDTTALVLTRPPLDENRQPKLEGNLYQKAHVWGVASGDEKTPNPPAHDLVERGPIRLDETVVPMIKVLAGSLRVLAIGADPYKFETQMGELEDLGFVVFRFDQVNSNMVPASELLYRLIVSDEVEHDDDPVFAAHMDAAAARDTGRGFRLSKRDATPGAPMDAAVAAAMGAHMARLEDVVRSRRPSVTRLA